MKARVTEKEIIVIFILMFFVTVFTGCNQSEVVKDKYPYPVVIDKGSIATGIYASTTLPEGIPQLQNSLFITNTNEPISILFHQHGKNRKFVLCVFFDYIQTRFRVGSQGEYLDKYVFEMNDNEQIEFPLFLSPDIVPDNKTHKLLLSFIAGPDEYAADKNDVTSEYGHVSLFDLSFSPEAYSRTTEIVEPIYPLSEQDNDLPFDHLDVVINTDYANDAAHYQWIKEPDKEYAVKTNEALALMYNISDSLRYSEAILVITIGYRQEPIFNQKYAVFHLKPDCVANGKFFVTTPSVPGKYEFIAYVVYHPFRYTSGTKADVPSTCYRFTLNVG